MLIEGSPIPNDDDVRSQLTEAVLDRWTQRLDEFLQHTQRRLDAIGNALDEQHRETIEIESPTLNIAPESSTQASDETVPRMPPAAEAPSELTADDEPAIEPPPQDPAARLRALKERLQFDFNNQPSNSGSHEVSR